MLSAKELQNINVETLEEGREFLETISQRIKEILEQMRKPIVNTEWSKLNNEGYELKKARRHIQQQMGKIVAQRRKSHV